MSWYQRPQKWIKGKRIRSLAHLARLTSATKTSYTPYIWIDTQYRPKKHHPHVFRNRQWSTVVHMFNRRQLFTTVLNPKWKDPLEIPSHHEQ